MNVAEFEKRLDSKFGKMVGEKVGIRDVSVVVVLILRTMPDTFATPR